ncbi:iron complex transport system permease protein [Solibacillus kalamii]|uniref:FecCD family ABC transporter permease n=1 Tax=Solibacillus kalamii TaxID=1748298 RepID=UPI001EF754CC|nr:iron ABC transporter permease [Solibacillus kalamii]MBM7663610.1 iron complex transport system permease protein [Solibacillus kalamii]
MKKLINLQSNYFSQLVDLSAVKKLFILLLIVVLTFILSLSIGDSFIAPLKVISILFGNGSAFDTLIVQEFRMPRIFISLFAGMGLAISGAILQGIIRNPLASPDVIGISTGAGTAVVAFLAIFSDANSSLTVSIEWMPFAAFIGALATALLVYSLAWKNGVSATRLVMIGVGIASFMQAVTTVLMLVGPIYQASKANVWITGSVNSATWQQVKIIIPVVTCLFIITLLVTRYLNLQQFGDDVATSLGQHVQKTRLALLLLCTALVGSAVSFAGTIGFVGLMAPHIARKLVGSSFGSLIPASACIGGILVVLADTIGRSLFGSIVVPAGVFTAAIGAPYFIYLLIKMQKR